jgi:hypothetical protein
MAASPRRRLFSQRVLYPLLSGKPLPSQAASGGAAASLGGGVLAGPARGGHWRGTQGDSLALAACGPLAPCGRGQG